MQVEWARDGVIRGTSDRVLGLPSGPGRLTLLRASDDWHVGPGLEIPLHATRLALHPDLERLIVMGPGRLELRRGTPRDVPTLGSRLWPHPSLALGFDASGQELWTSEEAGGQHVVRVLDGETLTDGASGPGAVTAVLDPELEGLHELMPHPSAPVMGVSVSQGQDGTWLVFLRREGGRLVREGALDSPDAPFFPAGFDASGTSFIGIGGTWVRRWSFPGCALLAEYALPEDTGTQVTDYSGLVTADSVFVVMEGLDAEGAGESQRFSLLQLDAGTLRPTHRLELPLEHEAIGALQLLPGGFLMADGRRLWRLADWNAPRTRL
ncbi:hypothetical protein DRW03_26790 [Corallococcus sp. H22C18031201]|nr:hypothetical protein DRW03_26790 [Corallococcus sp. H22C18031201]